MTLQNGYTVLYEKVENGYRVFSASKSGLVADAEEILKVAIGTYKLVYEKDGKIYGSVENVPTEADQHIAAFDTIFATGNNEASDAQPEEPAEEPAEAVTADDEEPVVEDDEPADDDEPVEDEANEDE